MYLLLYFHKQVTISEKITLNKTRLAEGRKLQIANRQLVTETELFLLLCLRNQEGGICWTLVAFSLRTEQLFLLACFYLLNTKHLPCWSSSGKGTRSLRSFFSISLKILFTWYTRNDNAVRELPCL